MRNSLCEACPKLNQINDVHLNEIEQILVVYDSLGCLARNSEQIEFSIKLFRS